MNARMQSPAYLLCLSPSHFSVSYFVSPPIQRHKEKVTISPKGCEDVEAIDACRTVGSWPGRVKGTCTVRDQPAMRISKGVQRLLEKHDPLAERQRRTRNVEFLPSTYSVTRQARPSSVVPPSISRATLGCSSRARMRRSLSKASPARTCRWGWISLIPAKYRPTDNGMRKSGKTWPPTLLRRLIVAEAFKQPEPCRCQRRVTVRCGSAVHRGRGKRQSRRPGIGSRWRLVARCRSRLCRRTDQ